MLTFWALAVLLRIVPDSLDPPTFQYEPTLLLMLPEMEGLIGVEACEL